MPRPPLTLFTVGHSTRTFPDFLALLRAHNIRTLVDVRHFPGSRRFPHFNKSHLARALPAVGIRYEHLIDLGGRRKPRPDSRNTAWRNASFRAYADYMETPPFRRAIARLLQIARTPSAGPTAIMCSEALWWRCHRSMIADYLKSGGIRVLHIMTPHTAPEHPYTSPAHLVDGKLSYESPSLFTPDPPLKESPAMPHDFKPGDHVSWNSEAGRVRGTIKKRIIRNTQFKTYTVHASKDSPQYLIQSDKTDHLAMHKPQALRKIKMPSKKKK